MRITVRAMMMEKYALIYCKTCLAPAVKMVMDLGYAAEGAGPLPNHRNRKELGETVSYL